MLWCAQALQTKATSRVVQSLIDSEAGQAGLVQGLQKALADRPELRDVLNKALNNSPAQR